MCLFKKKKKIVVDTKFKEGNPVRFRYRDELYFGWIYAIYPNEGGSTTYDVQVGGQCPMILKNIKEEELTLREDKKP